MGLYRWLGNLSFILVVLFLGASMACGTSASEERTSTTVSGGSFVADGDLGEVSDEEIKSFASAYIEVMAVQQQYHHRIQAAQGDDRDALARESENKIEEIITSYEMSSARFNSIMVHLPTDDDLRRRVQIEIQAQEEERLRILQEEQEQELQEM